jgi:ankyrin repeat protein
MKKYKRYTFVNNVEETYDDNLALKMIQDYFSADGDLNITNNYNESLLTICIRSEFFKSVLYLIQNGIDINKQEVDGNTPIMSAISLRMIKTLMNNGADINIQNDNKITLINYLLPTIKDELEENTEIIEYLLDNGADINIMDSDQQTFLMNAAENHFADIVYMFIDCDWNQKNIDDEDFFDILNNSSEIDYLVDDLKKEYPEKYNKYLVKKKSNKFNI